MSDPRATLAERIAECCPCRSGKKQDFCVGDMGWEGLAICLCGPELKHKNPPLNQSCLWPGHALAAEVGELERDKMGAEYDAGLERARADDAEMRAEAAEALLTEAPNPGYGQNAQ